MSITQIKPFRVERWFDDYETTCKYNIAETCAASLSVQDLKEISEAPKDTEIVDFSKKLVYGAIRGSDVLRSHLSGLYSARAGSPLNKDNILITNGAIAANFIGMYTLVGKGDHVICHYPTYQQLYSVPQSLGAQVDLWHTKPESKWELSIESLKGLIKENTKMIVINNPQNPTGAIVPKKILEQIVELAAEKNIIVFADEVYRPLFHSISPAEPDFPPSILSMGYKNVVATSSMSKAFALAGIRVGWLASRSLEIIEACAASRDYTTISVSQVDDQIATFAMGESCIHALLGRNITLAKTNVAILEDFINQHRDVCEWVKPRAGTTAMVEFSRGGKPVDDVKFCQLLQEKTGVFFAPGNYCFSESGTEFLGHVRVGYVCETQVLRDGLAQVDSFLKGDFAEVPTV